MPDILQIADAFRAQLAQREAHAFSAMTESYAHAWSGIKTALDNLQRQIRLAKLHGEEPSASWLEKRGRLQILQNQIQDQIAQFAQFAKRSVLLQQHQAVQTALQQSFDFAQALNAEAPAGVSVSWTQLHTGAFTDLVGFTSDGSPLRTLFDSFGADASAAGRAVLLEGLARGQNPRRVARDLRTALDTTRTRALTISRTETMRAYRTASLRTYEANDDVVKGWIWVASLSTRSCAMCIAMHGTHHPLQEPFASHPRCRCAPAPETRSWEELGFEGVEPAPEEPVESGVDWFAQQPEATQIAVLGKAKYRAYESGEITMPDLVGYRRDSEWGPMRWEKSLKSLVESAAA